MAKKTTSKNNNKSNEPFNFGAFLKSDSTRFVVGLFILILTIYASLSIISFFFTGAADQSKIEGISLFHPERISGIQNWTGTRGACLSNTLMNEWFGVSTLLMLFFFATLGLRLMKVKYTPILKTFILSTIGMIWLSVAVSFFFGPLFSDTAIYIGGKHGLYLSDLLKDNLGIPGTFLLLFVSLVIIMIFVSAKTVPLVRKMFTLKKKGTIDEAIDEDEADNYTNNNNLSDPTNPKQSDIQSEFYNDKKEEFENIPPIVLVENKKEEEKPFIPVEDDKFEIIQPIDEEYIPPVAPPNPSSKEETTGIANTAIDEEDNGLLEELGAYDPTLDLSNYQIPAIDLLKKYDISDRQVDMAEQNANKNKITQTLEHFGIKIKSIKATVGPTITLYEIVPEDGVRITKIKNLEDDIAMSLAALGIRIIAPMPGKGTIGIEVPNKDAQIVSMQSIIASKKFQESTYDLPVALGKTITNEVFMFDLCKMPHLLVAGATGQGKSVGLNAIITSLLYKKHPAELKFVMVDPKMVEFSIYSTIEKHFLAKLPDGDKPIITDFTKVIYTLNSLTKEMDDRYDLLMKAGTRNIKEYNEKFINRRLNPNKGHKFMPYIVVVIDEFGDLIMTAGKEIELPIARIAQKARAVGMHMVIATQRPTTNIITGTIKANFPARIAFRVTSAIDSRTILDGTGANQLIGRGDLLFSQGSDVTRVQCAFVDTPEVERISQFISSQQAYPTAFYLPEYVGEESEKIGDVDLSQKDPLFEDAARLIVIHQQGSTSLIQRKFSIGYNRAGRLMDQLEAAKIVGPTEGSKPRQVFIQDEYHLEQILQNIK